MSTPPLLRPVHLRRLYLPISSLALLLVFVTLLVTGANSVLVLSNLSRTSDLAQRNCRQVEIVKAAIHQTLADSIRTLGKPGTAGYDYYRVHPVELLNEIKVLQGSIVKFDPLPC